jgi:hypothetical protein
MDQDQLLSQLKFWHERSEILNRSHSQAIMDMLDTFRRSLEMDDDASVPAMVARIKRLKESTAKAKSRTVA